MGQDYTKHNLLFISKYPEIIHEFSDAMKDRDIEIETAQNGIEAAAKIKKKNYDVVITGLSLEGYNGEQLITYLNKTAPVRCVSSIRPQSARRSFISSSTSGMYSVYSYAR